jgi:peptide/nickel transport system substrate-binding protein
MCSALLGGCRPNGATRSADRPYEVLVPSEPQTLDPRHAVDAFAVKITRLVHAGLMTLDPDTLEPKPFAARKITFADPTTADVEIAPGILFHSGAPLRATDVVATLRAWMNPAVNALGARLVEPIASVEETGPLSLRIHLKRPHATLLTDLELPILRADEAASPPRPDGSHDGLGPYRVVSFTPGEVRLVPAEHGVIVAKHAVTIRTVRDENARALRLIADRADIAVNAFSPTLLPALEREKNLRVSRRPGANVTYLLLRVDRPPFDRLEARRAVSLAINRRALTEGLMAGVAHPASSVLPATLWAHADAEPLPFDPAAAGRDLATLATTGGLHFGLLTTPDRVRLSIARTIAQELGDAGAHVETSAIDLGSLLARLTAGDFEAAILNLPELTEPNVLRLFMHSESVPPNGTNRGRIRDIAVDRLLDEGATTLDRSARRAVYARLEQRLRETHLFVPLWHEDQVWVASERARPFTPSAEGRWLGLATLP